MTKYHYLPDAKIDNPQYIITNAPLNSSGDIYHILSYLFLSQARKKETPHVELTYDTLSQYADGSRPTQSKLTTEDQVKRSMHFVTTFPVGKFFSMVQIPYNKVGRENVRQDQLNETLKNRVRLTNTPIFYIDQMATTTLISADFAEYGYEDTTQKIRDGFSRFNKQIYTKTVRTIVDNYVAESMLKLEATNKDQKPLVVLHIRHSSKANKELNLPEPFIESLAQMISQQGYQVCIILADDRNKSYKPTEKSFVVLEPFKNKKLYLNGIDYAKHAHLGLLMQLQKNSKTRAVIGNTSGTLDLAALIGLVSYSIHSISKADISYQECRLFFQALFMTIARFDFNNESTEVIVNQTSQWLQTSSEKKNSGLFIDQETHESAKSLINEKQSVAGYEKMFYGRLFRPDGLIKEYKLLKSHSKIKEPPLQSPMAACSSSSC